MAETSCPKRPDGKHIFTPATCVCGRCLGDELEPQSISVSPMSDAARLAIAGFVASTPAPVASSSAPHGFSRVKIVSPDPTGHRAKVTVDGVEPDHLTRVDLKLEVNVHVPPTLEERVRRALDRVKGGGAAMRIPADPSDFDLVLTDVLTVLELARGVTRG